VLVSRVVRRRAYLRMPMLVHMVAVALELLLLVLRIHLLQSAPRDQWSCKVEKLAERIGVPSGFRTFLAAYLCVAVA
jgi:hypothetical protein